MPETPAIGATLGSLFPMGVGAGLGAEGAGLMGLFGQLLQGVPAAAEGGVAEGDTLVALMGGLVSAEKTAGMGATTRSLLLLGKVSVTVQASAEAQSAGATEGEASVETQAVQMLTQTVSALYQQLSERGFSLAPATRATELANALTSLGVPAEEAQGIAAQIETMMALVEKNLQKLKGEDTTQPPALEGDEATSLAAVLMATMVPQLAQNAALQNGETGESNTELNATAALSVRVEVSLTQTQTVMIQLPRMPQGFSARDALLAEPVAQANTHAALPVQAPAQAQIALMVSAAEEGESAGVQLVLPAAGEASAQTLAENATRTVAQPQVQKLEAPQALQGRVLYTLKEDSNGTTLVEAVSPASQGEEVAPRAPVSRIEPLKAEAPTAQPMTADMTGNSGMENAAALQTPAHTQASRFAEHLKQAAQAQVGQQVAVAIQPMLKQGEGGAVRMILNPPELGRIDVHLKIENGEVSGVLRATEPATVEHLARELPALKQTLADAGLKLGEQGLSLMLGQQNPEGQRQPNPFAQAQSGQGSGAAHSVAAEDDGAAITMPSPAARWVSPDRVLDREV